MSKIFLLRMATVRKRVNRVLQESQEQEVVTQAEEAEQVVVQVALELAVALKAVQNVNY
jgi:hypothetical protein